MSLLVFGENVALKTIPSLTQHNRRFLELIAVKDISHVFYRKATLAEVNSVASALTSRIEPAQSFTKPAWLFIFNHGPEATESVSTETTHAFSVFTETTQGMRHQYFESANGVFAEVSSLSVTLTTIPDIDDIRLLHFAKFPLGELPATSAILEFKAEAWESEAALGRGYPSLRIRVLDDVQRITGALTIGLYGDPLYAALLGSGGGGGGNCGNAEVCPPGGQGSCEPVPPSESAGYRCVSGNGPIGGGDGVISVFDQAISQGLLTSEAADFRLVRAFIADFLPQHARGKRFISLYYTLSIFLRFDSVAMREYIDDVQHVSDGLRKLLYGTDNAVVVNDELREALLRIIALHERVDHPVAQRILPVMRAGVTSIAGKCRSEVIDLLNTVA